MRKPTLILVLFLLLGLVYAVTTPIFEASDELWHYPLVRHLAQGNPLPVQDPEHVGPWKQEASQQPLYYYLGAALTFWIDTSDMETVRWLNPHVDNGILTADGNTNLVIHRPDQEAPERRYLHTEGELVQLRDQEARQHGEVEVLEARHVLLTQGDNGGGNGNGDIPAHRIVRYELAECRLLDEIVA